MSRVLFALAILVITNFSFAQESETLREFKKDLTLYALNFEKPEGYVETEVIDNHDLAYSYALLHEDVKLEIRYTLFSIKNMIEQNKKSGGVSVDPNKMYQALVTTNQLNLSGGNEYQVTRFDSEAVKEEFNADAGATTFFPLNSKFGEGYKNCMMVVLHKKDIADAFILFLFDDPEVFQNNAMDAFHALTFE